MDNLKLVLEHKFWILALVAVLLPPIGWWMATGDLAASTTKSKTEIESAFKMVPDPAKDQYANKSWIENAKQANEKLTRLVEQSQQRLFDRQRREMTWPSVVQKALNEKKVKYQGEIVPDIRRMYANYYDDEWRAIVKMLDRFNPMTGEGKVLLLSDTTTTGESIIPRAPVEQWQNVIPPTSQEMWDQQEDIWLLRSLVKSIAAVNKGAVDISNSHIKRIMELTLRGGSQADLASRRNPAGANGSNDRPNTSTSNRPANALVYKAPPAFDPDDLFGSDGKNATVSTDRGGGRMSGGGGGSSIIQAAERYVDGTSKSKNRGFVLHLVMDESAIPSLLGELTDSPFPVEIRHVEHAHFNALSSRANLASLRPNSNYNPQAQENQAEAELQRKIDQKLMIAMNQNDLAEVYVAGVYTLYNEPKSAAAAAEQNTSAASVPAPAQQPVAAQKAPPATAPTVAPKSPAAGKQSGVAIAPAPKEQPAAATKAAGTAPAGKAPTAPPPDKAGAGNSAVPKAATPTKSQNTTAPGSGSPAK